nr:hypothetical protein B0A51_01818 [Rachicladosporium sp. CCFEE 5018]
MADAALKSLHPFLQHNSTTLDNDTRIESYTHDHGDGVILCMVHGYPQSSYMFVVPALKDHYSLFVPELPNYGVSTTTRPWNKRDHGHLLLRALHATLKSGSTRQIIWCSHDRGARIGHRLLTSPSSLTQNIKAAIFMDIVPSLEQWRSFANPAASVAYFHWPFLARPDAPEMITSMGGAKYCRLIMERGKGQSSTGVESMQSDGAWEHYCAVFDTKAAIDGSCADYTDGAMPECDAQSGDQKEGKKVQVPLLVLYSEGSLARMHDVPKVWKDWATGELECVGVGEGHGHYFPESKPEFVVEQVKRWVAQVMKSSSL